jgi:hypothetical protein
VALGDVESLKSETNPTHLYIPADEEETRHVGMLQTLEQTGSFSFVAARASCRIGNPTFVWGNFVCVYIRLGVMLVALVVAANTRQPQSETERLKTKSMSERPRQPEYGFGSEMAKTQFKFPILVICFSRISLNATVS